jgi:hypothetical protein
MKKSRFTEEQIIYALRLADSGTAVVDVCRQPGHSGYRFSLLLNHLGCMTGLFAAQFVGSAYVLSTPPGCMHSGL